MTIQLLTAEPRSVLGGKVKKLRKEGLLPGNVFGKNIKSYSVQVDANEFRKVFAETGETGIVELNVGKKKSPVLVSNVQSHPVTGDALHVDFRQVDLTEKITATVPVELVGESPAEKSGLGTVVQQTLELEVEALPADLPEMFEVNIANLSEVDMVVLVKDLKYNKSKVKIEADPKQIVAKVEPPQEEKVEEVPETTEAIETEGKEGAPVAESKAAEETP